MATETDCIEASLESNVLPEEPLSELSEGDGVGGVGLMGSFRVTDTSSAGAAGGAGGAREQQQQHRVPMSTDCHQRLLQVSQRTGSPTALIGPPGWGGEG
jgi:hypothetical protein